MKKNNLKFTLGFSLLLGLLVSAFPTQAIVIFYDDFEDGNYDGWLLSSNGTSSTGVEEHNASLMAFERQTGSGRTDISHDFDFASDALFSFDMHAVAYPTSNRQAGSGVTISFLTTFNSSLGHVNLTYRTDGIYGTHDIQIDNTQHTYTNTMEDFAIAAGLNSFDSVSTMNVRFFTWGSSSSIYGHSRAAVWFDDVTIDAVPLPAAFWLFGSGAIGLLGIARRKIRI